MLSFYFPWLKQNNNDKKNKHQKKKKTSKIFMKEKNQKHTDPFNIWLKSLFANDDDILDQGSVTCSSGATRGSLNSFLIGATNDKEPNNCFEYSVVCSVLRPTFIFFYRFILFFIIHHILFINIIIFNNFLCLYATSI